MLVNVKLGTIEHTKGIHSSSLEEDDTVYGLACEENSKNYLSW